MSSDDDLEAAERALSRDGAIDRALLDRLVQKHYDLPYPPDHYYMPIPLRQAILDQDADRRPLVPGPSWLDEPAVDDFLQSLAAFIPETAQLPDYWDIHKLGLGLGFGEAEGQTYYAVVRASNPDVVIEFGSGLSTYYAVEAVRMAQGYTKIICIEPYPTPAFVEFCVANGVELIPHPVQQLDLAPLLARLTARSVVFIDTTHVLRPDGELSRIFLEVLPAMPIGALAHLHDIFFPYAVIFREHEAFAFSRVWNETLALAVYLRENSHWQVVHPGYWLARVRPEKYWSVFSKMRETKQVGSSLWMRRV